MRLKNKVAVITGGSRGIGFATADKFLKEGATVIITASSRETVDRGVERLREKHPEGVVEGISPNLASLDSVRDAFKKVVEKYGRVDILVNNAGITRDGLVMGMSEEDFDAVIDTNLKGSFNCIRFASRQMMRKKYGRIINITSVSGVAGNAGQANYSASKAGLIGLTKSVAKELASRNITANAIAPGFVKTEMTEVLSDDVKEAAMKQIPLGRFAEPEDIANAAVFLASDMASYITGQVLLVDGGMVM